VKKSRALTEGIFKLNNETRFASTYIAERWIVSLQGYCDCLSEEQTLGAVQAGQVSAFVSLSLHVQWHFDTIGHLEIWCMLGHFVYSGANNGCFSRLTARDLQMFKLKVGRRSRNLSLPPQARCIGI
jgi:hypothetical protein